MTMEISKEKVKAMKHTRGASKEYRFSIVIPVLNEQNRINSLIEHVHSRGYESACEIIVADGDPQGGTIKVIRDENVISITSKKGRASQMNAGAELAHGEVLIFLHADTKLPPNALEKISQVLEDAKYVGGAFDLGIDSDSLLLKYIAARTCGGLFTLIYNKAGPSKRRPCLLDYYLVVPDTGGTGTHGELPKPFTERT